MRKLGKIIIYIILAALSITTILPFIYLIATAFTPDSYTLPFPPILIPKSFYLGNFIEAITSNNFDRYFLNSIFVSVISTIFAIIVSTMTAYGFARFQFKGKEAVFKILLFTMMVPGM